MKCANTEIKCVALHQNMMHHNELVPCGYYKSVPGKIILHWLQLPKLHSTASCFDQHCMICLKMAPFCLKSDTLKFLINAPHMYNHCPESFDLQKASISGHVTSATTADIKSDARQLFIQADTKQAGRSSAFKVTGVMPFCTLKPGHKQQS